MPELFRVARTHALPPGTEVVDKGGKPHARVKDGGRWALHPLTKSGTGYLKPSPTWCAEVRDADGKRRRVRLSPVKAAAQAMLSKLLLEAEEGKAGIRTKLTGSGRLLLADLLDAYGRHQLDRGSCARHAGEVVARCRAALDALGMLTLADLDPTPAERWLADRRSKPRSEGGIGRQTSNHVVAGLRAFGNFLVKTDRAAANPFRHLVKLNVEADVRHARREFTTLELSGLIDAARAGKPMHGVSGPDRAMLYLVASMTGLRASELASLTRESFKLDAASPAVVVEAGYSKRRRRDTVPLHAGLVEQLRPWLAGFGAGATLWPGNWAHYCYAGKFVARDLAAARAAWVAAGDGAAGKESREAADDFKPRDRDGRHLDFHGLRHSFISSLVRAGVTPAVAMKLARHSTITLTIDRYTHVSETDAAEGLGKLTAPRVAPGVATAAHGCGPVTASDESCGADATPRGPAAAAASAANPGGCGRLATHEDTRGAEGEGFEPSVGASPTSVFKTDALNRSATLPGSWTRQFSGSSRGRNRPAAGRGRDCRFADRRGRVSFER